jgi:hypothetical protein
MKGAQPARGIPGYLTVKLLTEVIAYRISKGKELHDLLLYIWVDTDIVFIKVI